MQLNRNMASISGIKKIVMKNMIINTHGASPAAVATLADIFGESGLSSVNCYVYAVNNHEEANPSRITSVSIRRSGQVLIYVDGSNTSNMSIMFVGMIIDG